MSSKKHEALCLYKLKDYRKRRDEGGTIRSAL